MTKRPRTASSSSVAAQGVNLAAALAGIASQYRNSGGASGGSIQGPENSADAARNAITAQHDIGRSYYNKRKKRLTKKAKKRRGKQKRFKKKVRAIVSGSSPTYHYNERCSAPLNMGNMPTVWATSPSQQVLGSTSSANNALRLFCGLNLTGANFSDASTTDIGRYINRAISNIATRYNAADLLSSNKNFLSPFKCVIKHSAINFTIVNMQATPISVDVYEFVATRDIGQADLYSTPYQAMSSIRSFDANNLTVDMSNTINITDFGATPWDFPGLKNSWKVLSKTTIYIQSLGQTNLQFKGPRGMWGGNKVNEMCSLKGKTRDFMFIVGGRIAYGLNDSSTPIKVYWEKTYKIKPPAGHTWATEGILSAQSYTYA